MLISYTIKLTVLNNITNSSVIFNKNFESEITTINDNVLYDNYHVLHSNIYVLDLFAQEVKDYCEAEQITSDDVIIDEYEITTLTENVEVFFENPVDINAFTLKPDIKCYIYPKEPPLPVPNLHGTSYDSNTIVWTWPDDEQYAHYLISEPVDFTSEEDKTKIIATIPIGANHYVETGLEPNTAYSRRLINYTDTQTSLPSGEVTVTTETVNPQISLDKYYIEREHDWTITDNEREVVKENLTAFKSGIGDFNDLKVYKQMDKDFYEKFKAYFILTGKYTQREKRYDQVGFNYKICLEAKETIEEQEGEVTFKLDAYPWQEMYKTEYLWATKPVTVYARVYAFIDLYKEIPGTNTVKKKIKWKEKIHHEAEEIPTSVNIVIDLSSSMRNTSNGKSRLDRMKKGAKAMIDTFNSINNELEYLITGFATSAHTEICSTASDAKSVIDSMHCGSSSTGNGYMQGNNALGNMTNWKEGLIDANGKASKPTKVMLFFTDGFPNRPGSHNSTTQTSITQGMNQTDAQKVYAIFGQAPVAYYDDGLSYSQSYVTTCHNNIINHSKCIGYTNSNIDDDSILDAFGSGTILLTPAWDEIIPHEEEIDVEIPHISIDYKTVHLESETLSFTFDNTKTPVGYKDSTKRAEVLQKLSATKMSNKSILELLTAAKEATPEWQSGYNKNNNVKDEDGNIIGDVFKNIHIKDTYTYGDEDPIPSLTFNTNYDYGMMGTINVNSDVPNLSTTDNVDDEYVATNNSFVWISGYTNAIIYDCTRYGHVAVNAYNRPQETIFFKNDLANLLKNRENKNYTYGNSNIDSSHIFKKELVLKVPDPNYMQIYGDGIDQDMIVKIDTHWQSPVLNYRFNLLDPDAYTPYYEILPDCNPNSQDKHVIILTVYYAKNVEINSTALNDNYYALFDYTNPAQNPLEFKYGLNATWNYANNIYDCDGHWISQYVHFFARKMLKTQDYYDEIPGPNMDSMYGLVNGRYREDNLSGKQDLIVDTPEFNIPTTVLATHADTIKIYIRITEFYPSDALVSYKWHHESPVGSGYTQINGDYVTFSSDSLTYKDIDYYETLSTYETEQIEMFSQEPLEMIQQITRPVADNESENDLFYNYLNTEDSWKDNCELNGDNSIQINQGGTLSGPFATLEKGRYKVKFSGDNLTACIFSCNSDSNDIDITIEEQTDEEIIYRFTLLEKTENIEFKFSCNPDADAPVYIDGYFVNKTSGNYDNYYLKVETDNGDVLATRYPTEVVFDDDNNCIVPVTYRGIINATSKWSPRIHNGYYYTNQHERYLYSEFDVKADFDKTEETVYDEGTVFINFDVNMKKDGGPKEDYSINKNTIVELLQDEEKFTWEKNKGLTLKPVIEGQKYKHYEAATWYSPVILFDNPLTVANALKLDYVNTDGSNTGLELFVRSFDLEEGKWTDWTPFTNNTVPNTILSCGYQLKTVLSATEQHTPYEWDDYLCCYLDWVDYIDDAVSQNIVTITDHITTGIYNSDGYAISKIIQYACPTGISLDMFTTSNKVIMNVAYSNDINDLILENIQWQPMTTVNLNMGYKYYRFRIIIPKNEKVYWVHLSVKTLETEVVLPYIKGISMTGSYEPEDITGHFMKLETFKITKDGFYHEVVPQISDYISSEVIEKGFELNNITSIDIKSTNPDVFLLFDTNILNPNPDPSLLNGSIQAAASEATIDLLNQLPYIFTKNNKITITGTPQQYCPITVEDVNGIPFKEIYNVNPDDMVITEIHTMQTKENYIELKRNDFELETMKVWINDNEIEDYSIVNHLLMFKNFLDINDVVTVTYNVENSFYTEIDRKNNTTTIYPYSNKEIFKDPDTKIYLEEYKGMTLQEMYSNGIRFSNLSSSNSSHAKPTEESSWNFDTTLNSFITTVNSISFNGFVTTELLEAYEHEVTIISTNADDDVNGVIIGHVIDENNIMHTLSFLVTRGGWSAINHYALVYDFCLPTQKILQVIQDPNLPTTGNTGGYGWNVCPNGIRLKISKNLNNITCKASVWNDPTTWNEDTLIEFDLNSDTDTAKFAKGVYYGYCNQSQAESYYTDIYFQAYIVKEVRKKYKVMFETNKQTNKFVAKKLSLNPVYRTDYSGFIYLTEEHNVPYKIKIWCNPKRVKAGGLDSVDVQIEVLDIINNPVIAKEVKIDCNNGTLRCDDYETDMNGVVHAIYESSYFNGVDTITAKVLLDDELTNLETSIQITSY